MARKVMGLQWARPCEKPQGLKKTRPRGTKALGLAYERRVATQLPSALHGPWYEFEDKRGHGYCQPDFVILGQRHTLILEVKLTDIIGAKAQLLRLYSPIISHIYDLPTIEIILVKHLSALPQGQQVFPNLRSAIVAAKDGVLAPVVHWLGHDSLI